MLGVAARTTTTNSKLESFVKNIKIELKFSFIIYKNPFTYLLRILIKSKLKVLMIICLSGKIKFLKNYSLSFDSTKLEFFIIGLYETKITNIKRKKIKELKKKTYQPPEWKVSVQISAKATTKLLIYTTTNI
ncbi:hypothetical protein BpHYR1_019664, partial [Brachionus plicatilis]